MANRTKTGRNDKIWNLVVNKGYRHESVARIYKMKTSTVSVVIHRERKKREGK